MVCSRVCFGPSSFQPGKTPFWRFRQNFVNLSRRLFWDYVVDSFCTIMVYTGVTMALAKQVPRKINSVEARPAKRNFAAQDRQAG